MASCTVPPAFGMHDDAPCPRSSAANQDITAPNAGDVEDGRSSVTSDTHVREGSSPEVEMRELSRKPDLLSDDGQKDKSKVFVRSQLWLCKYFLMTGWKYIFSFFATFASMFIIAYATIFQFNTFWKAVHPVAALVIGVGALSLLAVVEGLQIALVELKKSHADSYRKTHKRAYRVARLAFKSENTERFLMGRQVFVVCLVFFAAKLTSIVGMTHFFGLPVPAWLSMGLLESGLLGCVVVVVLAQLTPQIIAAKWPVQFLNIPGMKATLLVCLFVEWIGITHICWGLAQLWAKVFRYPRLKHELDNGVLEGIDQAGIKLSDEIKQGDDNEAVLGSDDYYDHFRRFQLVVDNLSEEHSNAGKTDVHSNVAVALHNQLNKEPQMFRQFPSTIGNRMFASPGAIQEQMRNRDLVPPKFLLPVGHPDHIPPHIAACTLLAENRRLRSEIEAQQNASTPGAGKSQSCKDSDAYGCSPSTRPRFDSCNSSGTRPRCLSDSANNVMYLVNILVDDDIDDDEPETPLDLAPSLHLV